MNGEFVRDIETTRLDAYYDGIKTGLKMFAWMRDGVYYVGTCGTTLREAVSRVSQEREKALRDLDAALEARGL